MPGCRAVSSKRAGVESSSAAAAAHASDPEDQRPDAHLLHGPASDGGPSQADVDALFSTLGSATEGKAKPAAGGEKPGKKSTQKDIDAMFN